MLKVYTIFLLIFMLGNFKLLAQYDIVAYIPPVWDRQNGGNEGNVDLNSEYRLVFTVPSGTTDADIRISNSDGSLVDNITVPEGTSAYVYELDHTGIFASFTGTTTDFNSVETDQGLVITSTNDVGFQVTYRYVGFYNQNMATMKGSLALGQEFFAVSQVRLNSGNWGGNENHFISIMATEDDTDITLTTSDYFDGSTALEFDVTGVGGQVTSSSDNEIVITGLDQYETVLVKSPNDNYTLVATHIVSDKNIAVISGDEHVRISDSFNNPSSHSTNGTNADGAIDQLYPIELLDGGTVLGTEYIIPRGGNDTGYDYAVIIATEDGTVINVDDADGTDAQTYNLDKGDFAVYVLPGGNGNIGDASYIHATDSDKPFYLYHYSGNAVNSPNQEVGLSIVPEITKLGSTDLLFPRFSSQADNNNAVHITIPTAELSSLELQLNGETGLLAYNHANYPGITTHTVPGSPNGESWSIVTIPNALLDDGETNRAAANEYFHLSIGVRA